MKISICALSTLLVFTVPAFAGVTISSPSAGDHVSSPFTLSASSTSCSDQSVSSMGYSLDSGDTTMVNGNTSFDETLSASAGTHTVHVTSWGSQGAVCVSDVAITVSNVTDDVSADTSTIPSGASSVSNIQKMSGWRGEHDSGTSGSSSGKTILVGSPSYNGTAREFATNFHGASGERYSQTFGDNRTSTNFFYDVWVYIKSSSDHISNIEMDVNQTIPNGDTVIFGVQCDGFTGKWDYTENLGSATHPKGHWASSSASCNPRSWSTGKWHHVQAEYSRSSTGHITYKAIWFDGKESVLNKYVFGARSMHWGSSISTNFQVDGRSSGAATVYIDDLKVSRW